MIFKLRKAQNKCRATFSDVGYCVPIQRFSVFLLWNDANIPKTSTVAASEPVD